MEQVHEPIGGGGGGVWTEQNGRGEKAQILRLPVGFLEASWPFIYCIATAKEMAMCNDVTCA